jgi:hypothetical protein
VACLYADVVGPYRGHVAASGSDTWQADLDISTYRLIYLEVTRVTIRRVTRGR